MSRWKNREGVQEHPTKHEDNTLNLPLRASNRGLSINGYAGPSAQCRAVCSMQGRLLNAGAVCSMQGPSAQCRAVCSMQGRLHHAAPYAQCKGRLLNAGAVCSMQEPSAQRRNRLLNAGAVGSLQGPSAQWAVCSMQGRLLNSKAVC